VAESIALRQGVLGQSSVHAANTLAALVHGNVQHSVRHSLNEIVT